MAQKFDYKKEYPDLYLPGKKPMPIQVGRMRFLMVDGKGAPESEEYQSALKALYAVAFTIKMSRLSTPPEGYFEYVVPPLEGLWHTPQSAQGPQAFTALPRQQWQWTSMLRQPDFVTPQVFQWALEECRRKKPEVDCSKIRLEAFEEGLCVQMLHLGPYSEEETTLSQLREWIRAQGYRDDTGESRRHHELYLSDPRRCAPQRMKTVLRLPISRA